MVDQDLDGAIGTSPLSLSGVDFRGTETPDGWRARRPENNSSTSRAGRRKGASTDFSSSSLRGFGFGRFELRFVIGIDAAIGQEEEIRDEFRIDRPWPGVLDLYGLGSNGAFRGPIGGEPDVALARDDLRWCRVGIPQINRKCRGNFDGGSLGLFPPK